MSLPHIPGYAIFRELGKGGFGLVYHGRCLSCLGDVAIKILAEWGADGLDRFAREARILRSINSPNVVRLIGSDLRGPLPFIAMEYCEYGTLRSWVGARRPWRDVAAISIHVAHGLVAIHKAGGFHRDIKPDNLFLARAPDERSRLIAKVGDFGLARVPSSLSLVTRSAMGTMGYIAPEVLAGSPFTPAADVYSFGVTITELVTGTRDFESLDRVAMPPAFRTLLKKMMSPASRSRPPVEVVVRELEAIERTANAPPQPQTRPDDGSIWPWLLGGALVVAAVAGIAAADES